MTLVDCFQLKFEISFELKSDFFGSDECIMEWITRSNKTKVSICFY